MTSARRGTAGRVQSRRAALAIVLGIAALLSSADRSSAEPASASTTPSSTARAPHAEADPALAPLGSRLRDRLAATPPGEAIPIRVTLRIPGLPPPGARRRALIAEGQDRLLASPPLAGRALRRRYREVPGFALSAPATAIVALRHDPDVLAIHLDGEVHATTTEGRALMGVDAFTDVGVLGTGINVAVLDTGFDSDHPDLMSSLVGERCYCDVHPSPVLGGCCPGNLSEATGPGSAEDDQGHGTAVSGVITGDGVVASMGVAPAAGIFAVKVLSSSGTGADSDIDAALDWILGNHDDPSAPIHLVNMSLSNGGEFDSAADPECSTTPVALAIADLATAGVAVFAASGNDGYDAGISAPACAAEAISVGGVYDDFLGSVSWCGNATCTTILCTDSSAPDGFVCHSNSGALLDVLAPDWRTRTSALGGGSLNFGGTSAASPYAAGVAALLLELAPGLSPASLRADLSGPGVPVTNADNGLSFPRIDVAGSVAAALPDCGNGVLDAGESCDDGNVVGGDCCTAICSFEAAGSACSDESVCTSGDQCDGAGACIGVSIVCDDANACTDDACDPIGGCAFVPNANPCDDGDACTEGDACAAGVCAPGTPLVCDDANPCTDDACDPLVGCEFVANVAVCDDGDACTSDDACSGGLCVAGAPLDCDDLDACTADACDALEGCTHEPIPACGAPPVPTLGAKGRIGLVLLLGSAGVLMALLIAPGFTRPPGGTG